MGVVLGRVRPVWWYGTTLLDPFDPTIRQALYHTAHTDVPLLLREGGSFLLRRASVLVVCNLSKHTVHGGGEDTAAFQRTSRMGVSSDLQHPGVSRYLPAN